MTYNDLKKLRMKAKKEKNKIKDNSLMMLIDKIEKLAKDKNSTPDLFIQDGVKKYLKELEDSKANNMMVEDEIKFIKELAEQILPKMLDEDELYTLIQNIISNLDKPNMGLIMKELKTRNDVDMKLASKLIKEML